MSLNFPAILASGNQAEWNSLPTSMRRTRFFANIGNFRNCGGRPFDSMTESRGGHCSLTTHGTGDTGGPVVVRLHTYVGGHSLFKIVLTPFFNRHITIESEALRV